MEKATHFSGTSPSTSATIAQLGNIMVGIGERRLKQTMNAEREVSG